MAAEADIIRYVITGEEDEIIPENATHVSVHPSVKVIPRRIFFEHPNIVELICHDGVIKIEVEAFFGCRRLKRVIMNCVEEIEDGAFRYCTALEYVECDKLEIIGQNAFRWCESMTSFNLPSAKINRGWEVFYNCRSLERITIPLRNGLFDHDNTFRNCMNLRHIDLIEGAVLQLTIDALLWEEWKNNLNAELVSIAQILPNTHAGNRDNEGDKAIAIRQWIRNVLDKIIDYKSQHRRLLKEAESRLQLALPNDIVMNSVAPFLELPKHTFDGEEESSDDSNESMDETYSSTVDINEEDDDHDCSQGGAADSVGERKQKGANDVERRKRQRTE